MTESSFYRYEDALELDLLMHKKPIKSKQNIFKRYLIVIGGLAILRLVALKREVEGPCHNTLGLFAWLNESWLNSVSGGICGALSVEFLMCPHKTMNCQDIA